MGDLLLDINIVDPVLLSVFFALSAIAVVYLVVKKRTAVWIFTAFVVLLFGAAIGIALVWFASAVLNAFGGPVDRAVWIWVPAAFAGILLAVFNLWGSRWWRKLVAVLAILLFGATATLGINAAYGITPTLGALLHISTAKPVPVPTPAPTDAADPDAPLFETWTPPPGMPATGTTGTVPGGIPNTNSGFPARPAQLYLPPAAQVEAAPALPLVIMMMGQPGDPDPQYIAQVLEEYQARNRGLAPIVLVIDQLSDPSLDPLCLDTDRFQVETYVMDDVVPWAKGNLNVLHDPRFWTIAGYSNGAQCSASFGAKHPEVFGNILSVSPEEFPGADDPSGTLDGTFHGDQAAYDAEKPANIMAAHAPYPDTTAIFTVGENDPAYIPGAQRLAAAATDAGMQTTLYIVPGAGHVVDALMGGLEKGFEVLYPRLGLSRPSGG